MQKFYKPTRLALIFVVMVAFLSIYVSALYKMQIYDAQPAEDELYPKSTVTRISTLAAARGNIYDRNGILLASSRPSYNITLSHGALKAAPNTNEIIQKLIYAAAENGINYTDTFPITRGAPFAYLSNMTTGQRSRLDKYIEYFKGLESGISASDLFVWMKDHYGIDYTIGISDARLIIGIRYELETRLIEGLATTPYVFAEDVGADFAAFVEEQGLLGVYVETTTIREYHTTYAAHILGYTGRIDPNDVEMYLELGYPRDARVGRSGAELAFEEYLHGTDGSQNIETSDAGSVMSVETIKEPKPGSNVYLTLDIRLQAAVEDALTTHIDTINLERDENSRVTGGAAVVTDVKTGALLAAASAPTFDLSTISQNISQLSVDESAPLSNRATQGKYNPGSTFKMVTALAGLRGGVISRWTLVNDTGRFTEGHESYWPVCWIYPRTGYGHGPLDVVGALENSCNYFFYHVGYRLGFRPIADTATDFGLGQKTGLEISEATGSVATREYSLEVVGEGWWDGKTLQSAIGQSYNYFTPVQLANYTATIANNGTRLSLSLLNKVKSADYSQLLYMHEPEVAGVIEETDFIRILQEGMRAVARTGTALSVFSDYPISVAAKTGTVQSDSSKIDDGVFVCYAPANNPEIAISIVVEKGTSGSAVMEIAKSILDYYFEPETTVTAVPEGELIP